MKNSAASQHLIDIVYTIAGILFCGFALKGFLVPNQFFDGGVTGISLLIHELYHWNIAVVIIVANLPFIIMGAFQVNKTFALRALAAVIGLALCLYFIPYPQITSDKLLVSIFGGVFMGFGVGLAMRGGCALDGIEILALYTGKRISFTVSEIILGINIIILSDINMPVMDGLTLLSRLPDANPLLKAVMVSAYGDMQNIRTAMNRGAFDFVCKPVDFDDLDVTMEKTIVYVKQLQETIAAIKENNILKMYVDENVLNFMTNKGFESSLLKNESLDATVMFIDVCGFTALTEQIPANTIVTLLNGLFDKIVKEVIAQGGHVDKFMGDAVMAVFRGDYHLDRAMDAALAVREQINSNEPIVSNGDSYKPQVSIGINSGEMVSGNIGSESLKRLDYTVIGDAVNMAQRLQSVAKAGQIVISEEVYHLAKESFKCETNGEHVLKNKAKPVVTYSVLE